MPYFVRQMTVLVHVLMLGRLQASAQVTFSQELHRRILGTGVEVTTNKDARVSRPNIRSAESQFQAPQCLVQLRDAGKGRDLVRPPLQVAVDDEYLGRGNSMSKLAYLDARALLRPQQVEIGTLPEHSERHRRRPLLLDAREAQGAHGLSEHTGVVNGRFLQAHEGWPEMFNLFGEGSPSFGLLQKPLVYPVKHRRACQLLGQNIMRQDPLGDPVHDGELRPSIGLHFATLYVNFV